jgi:hypothetical protein
MTKVNSVARSLEAYDVSQRRSYSSKNTGPISHNPAKTMDLFVNKGYQIPGSLQEGFGSLSDAIGGGIVNGYNYVTNVISNHWDYSTDFKARGQDVVEMMTSDYYQNQFGNFAWAATWSPTSLVLSDTSLGGTGGVINNIPQEKPASKWAAATIIAAKLVDAIYKDITTPRGPRKDPLDFWGAFSKMRSLNTPHPQYPPNREINNNSSSSPTGPDWKNGENHGKKDNWETWGGSGNHSESSGDPRNGGNTSTHEDDDPNNDHRDDGRH